MLGASYASISLYRVLTTNLLGNTKHSAFAKLPEFKGIMDQAIDVVVEKKAKRDQGRRETSWYLLDGLNHKIFKKPQQEPGHQPPSPESPPPPPKY